MNGCELSVGVTALAIAIAAQIEETEELSLLGAVLTQLGDTLATIASQRALCESRKAREEEKAQAEGEK